MASNVRKAGAVPVVGSNGSIGTHNRANTGGPCIVIGRKGSFGKLKFSAVPVFAIDTTFFVDRRNSQVDLLWLYYLLSCLGLDEVTKDSAIPGLDREDVYQHLVRVPPQTEQIAIAKFLDHACRRTQCYISYKEKLIELLEEQKRAVIHEAVTGKIDVRTGKPYTAYKRSGVDWFAEVPEHWQSAQIRRFCKVFAGATPSRSVARYWEGGSIPWLASGDVNARRIDAAREFITEEGHRSTSTKWIRPNSLVIALAGQGKTKGMVATIEFPTTCNQSLAAIEPDESISQYEFLAYYLESRYRRIRSLVGDGLRDGLNLEHVKWIPTPLPPVAEQSAIARYLDCQSANIDRHIVATQSQIELVTEYRTRLIADVVTGKLDVRKAAERLPEVDELGASDDHREQGETIVAQPNAAAVGTR